MCPGCSGTLKHTLFRSTDRFFRTTTREFDVVECADCGLIRLDPWPTDAELPSYYPPGYWFAPNGGHSGLMEVYRRLVLSDHVRFVERALQGAPPGIAIDVGCGGALFSRLLRERRWTAVGLDFSHEAALIAGRQNGVPVTQGMLDQSPLAPQSCSVITMFHVLEHLKDPAHYLQAAYDALKPGGRLVVQVPNAASWSFLLYGPNWLGVDVPRHLINFRVQDMRALLEYSGFRLMREKHFSLRDNPACIASSIAPGLDPMSRRVRKADTSPVLQAAKDFLYLGLYAASIPLALMEASAGAGCTVLFDARRD